MVHGTGIQGPLYEGTRCFHRRKVIYGLSPDDNDITIVLVLKKFQVAGCDYEYGSSWGREKKSWTGPFNPARRF
ncbi:hypothetical protein CsSME_00019254 [Camellia sinensis var. sinensis]